MLSSYDILDEQDPFGAKILDNGLTRFRWWVPQQARMVEREIAPSSPKIVLPDSNLERPMSHIGHGWHEALVENAGHGTRYSFKFWNVYQESPSWMTVPDPMSYWQEKDVHGHSRVLDPKKISANRITWNGILHENLILEQIHIGSFTKEGTFLSAIEKLPYLADVGYTAVQLMPVEATAAKANWGYDGVLKGALQPQYGTPEDFSRFVDAAHRHGMEVFTDQVYNHFAAAGNYIELHTPEFFKYKDMENVGQHPPGQRDAVDGYETPWGTALDLSRPEVRKFIEQLEWHNHNHYGTGGVRRDAVHGLYDDAHEKNPDVPHLLTQMTRQRKMDARKAGGVFHVINEDEHDRPTLYAYDDENRNNNKIVADMQWGDNFHHALFVAVTKDHVNDNDDIQNLLENENSYYNPYYKAISADLIVEAITTGNTFSLDTPRNSKTTPEDLAAKPDPRTKIVFSTNHDHIGNTPHGYRLAAYLKDDPNAQAKIDFINSLTALHPAAIPQFFMGQSWGSQSVFPFFASFPDEDMNEAYRSGRKKELSQFKDFVDPAATTTIKSAKLDWDKALENPAQIQKFKDLFAARREKISPHLASGIAEMSAKRFGENGVEITTVYGDGAEFTLTFNAGNAPERHGFKVIPGWGVDYSSTASFNPAIDNGYEERGLSPSLSS